jgi:hypothetical protein
MATVNKKSTSSSKNVSKKIPQKTETKKVAEKKVITKTSSATPIKTAPSGKKPVPLVKKNIASVVKPIITKK